MAIIASNIVLDEKETLNQKRYKVYGYLDVVNSKKNIEEQNLHINKNALLKYYSNLLFMKD